MSKKRIPLSLWLIGINLFISAFTFGGGYVVIPMIQKYYVDKKGLFTQEELMEMAAIAQSSPGAIAINLSVLAGYRCAKLKGAIISCCSAVLPPLLILSVISLGYQAFRDNTAVSAILAGMQAGVCALIVDLVITMCSTLFQTQPKSISILIPFSFLTCFFLQVNIALILGSCIFYCIGIHWYQVRVKTI